MPKRLTIGPDEAETIALKALAFLAGDGPRLTRFLADTGVGPEELGKRIQDRDLQAAVLAHLLGDESGLLVFSTEAGLAPETVTIAHHVLITFRDRGR